MKLYLYIFLLLITGIAPSFCQVLEKTTTWYSTRTIELNSGQDINETTTLITKGTSEIQFLRGGADFTFQIMSVNDRSAEHTEIDYNVSFQGMAGIVKLYKENEQYVFVIDFSQSAEASIKQKILIERFE